MEGQVLGEGLSRCELGCGAVIPEIESILQSANPGEPIHFTQALRFNGPNPYHCQKVVCRIEIAADPKGPKLMMPFVQPSPKKAQEGAAQNELNGQNGHKFGAQTLGGVTNGHTGTNIPKPEPIKLFEPSMAKQVLINAHPLVFSPDLKTPTKPRLSLNCHVKNSLQSQQLDEA